MNKLSPVIASGFNSVLRYLNVNNLSSIAVSNIKSRIVLSQIENLPAIRSNCLQRRRVNESHKYYYHLFLVNTAINCKRCCKQII
jgi:hypothetical protein